MCVNGERLVKHAVSVRKKQNVLIDIHLFNRKKVINEKENVTEITLLIQVKYFAENILENQGNTCFLIKRKPLGKFQNLHENKTFTDKSKFFN